MNWPWQDRRGKFSPLKAAAFALMFAPALWIGQHVWAGTFGRGVLGGLTYWSGLWASAVLLLALAITPLATIFSWRGLIAVRRMIGVTALIYSLAHVVVYFALRYWDFAYIAGEIVTRLSLIVAVVSTLGLAALGATSFDAAIARMGAARWHRLHGAVYVFAGLAVAHYLLSPNIYSDQYLVAGVFMWLMGWRVLKPLRYRRDPAALMVLALCAAVLTAAGEAAWTWFYHGLDPRWALGNNLNFTFGVAPAFKVLALGTLLAAVAAAQRYLQRPRTLPVVADCDGLSELQPRLRR